VNVLDLVVLAAMGAAGYFGYRLGFVARVTSWIGLGIGVALAIAFVDDVLDPLSSQPSQTRLLVALAFFLLLATAGQALGFAAGTALRRRLPPREGINRGDRIGGAVVGALGVLVALWLLVPALTSTSGWPARAARDSQIVRAINRYAPDPPPQAERLGRRVAEGPFPEVFSRLNGPGDVGVPPTNVLSPDVAARVADATVRVEGQACDQIQAGSGWVAAADLVVTNAHVVAGIDEPVVDRRDGRSWDGRVVSFDARNDVAILRVPGLSGPPLARGSLDEGSSGALLGFPQNGPYRVTPVRLARAARVSARDAYGRLQGNRPIVVLRGDVESGNSGGPVVDGQGRVVATVFAQRPASDDGYAVPNEQVLGAVRAVDGDLLETSCVER
jgi:S1-C subfamily serine protease